MFIVTPVSGWLTFSLIVAFIILIIMLCTGAIGKIKREWARAEEEVNGNKKGR